MMLLLPIQAIPNQSFSISLDSNFYDISIKFNRNVMGVSITKNNIILIQNVRTVAGQLLISYQYLAEDGNFFISTLNNELPDYTQFGINQFLYYLSASDLA